MKTNKIIALLFLMVFAFSACETEVEDPAGLRGVGVIPSITNFNPAVFDVKDLANTFIQFDLDVNTSTVSEVKIVVSFNGDKKRVEIKNFTTFPSTVQIFAHEAASLLGIQISDIDPGDVFNFELLTVQGSDVYRSSAAFNAAAVCKYDPDFVSGAYYVVSDDWDSEGNVTLTVDPDDPYIIYVSGLAAMDGVNEDQGPLKMEVNKLNFEVIAEKTVLASNAFGYTNFSYQGFGILNTCNGVYDMNFTITVDQGSFGQFSFKFTKL
ncbi:MAG: hypothetical protein GX128_11275 [Bacteroidales bacterium]|jgi:hypothetical protein|nr:hypothetical protein [Bacteroidales bacterium]